LQLFSGANTLTLDDVLSSERANGKRHVEKSNAESDGDSDDDDEDGEESNSDSDAEMDGDGNASSKR
jgi:hypothetical protein